MTALAAEKTQVRVWLARKNRTQKWLAKQLGISPSHLSLLLDGERTPSVSLATKLEALTGVRLPDRADAAMETAASR